MLEMTTVLAHNEKCPVRKIGEGLVIMAPEGDTTHSLDEIGSFIWDLLDGHLDLTALLDVILDEYEVSDDVARQDLLDFATQMLEAGLLIEIK